LSHLGVARELHAITGASVNIRDYSNEKDVPVPAIIATDIVKIEDPDLCHRFTARIIRNVKIGPSPKQLVDRLEAIGERSINNVADVTNYVMHELGQPMHSFDLDKLAGNRLVVRRARSGETIKTLDEVERKLDPAMLAICDAEKPVAVGGVMGGFDSGITGETTNVLLEVAYFKRENIRETSKKLNLSTEASYRFERGVDLENLRRASDRATEMICKLAGGEAGEYVDIFPTKRLSTTVESKDISGSTKRLTGLDVATEECIRVLSSLGIKPKDPAMTFAVPSWRHDIGIEEDLVEEVARHVGYEKIGNELPPAFGAGEYQPTELRKKRIRRSLTDAGFNEALSYSFIETEFDNKLDLVAGLLDDQVEEKFVTLRDSVIEGAVRMRPSLLPGLLDAVKFNFNHQRKSVRLFEVGKVFAAKAGEDPLPNERELLGVVLTGGETNADRTMPARELDFYDAKGAIEMALEAIGAPGATYTTADIKHLRPGQSAQIELNGKPIGSVGRINEEIAADYKFKQPVYVAEIDLQTALAEAPSPVVYRHLPKYPSVIRDVSFLVTRTVSFDDLRNSLLEQKNEILQKVQFVDIFEGKGLSENERSLTIRLEYRSDAGTLTESDVDSVHGALLASIEKQLGIRPRM
ncbi:MAG TPA: phenylalanine--tRNA ligase subunit beta, partial [Pyrinomonadaceae bacterium]|nr:phenylalanine--tRNA ligase subunit beta [Pyrinomonadaceae bacterium]